MTRIPPMVWVVSSCCFAKGADRCYNVLQAFAMYGLVWVVGSIVGNSIGGFLSHPVERMPEVFGSFTLLARFPFLLPCLVTTGITLSGLAFAWFALREVSASGLVLR